ncbi:unnamed protein product [Natator depressus]
MLLVTDSTKPRQAARKRGTCTTAAPHGDPGRAAWHPTDCPPPPPRRALSKKLRGATPGCSGSLPPRSPAHGPSPCSGLGAPAPAGPRTCHSSRRIPASRPLPARAREGRGRGGLRQDLLCRKLCASFQREHTAHAPGGGGRGHETRECCLSSRTDPVVRRASPSRVERHRAANRVNCVSPLDASHACDSSSRCPRPPSGREARSREVSTGRGRRGAGGRRSVRWRSVCRTIGASAAASACREKRYFKYY